MKRCRRAAARRTTPDPISPSSKICLKCAYRKLGGLPEKPCGTCLLLNVDLMAQVRARAALPLVAFMSVRIPAALILPSRRR
ncbi:MAG: hypothetical protein V4510_09785 [bacterium]